MNRRHYLKTLGVTAGAALSSVALTSPIRRRAPWASGGARPSQFGRTVDMVADAGCNPTGQEDCTKAVRQAAGDDTLLEFPPGTYLFAEPIRLSELTNFGIKGRGGATFEAPPDHNGDWLVVDRGRGLLFENVDLDVTAPNAAPTLKLGVTDGLVVRDVEVVGRGTRRDSRLGREGGNVEVGHAFLPIVRSSNGAGIVENFVARHGGRIGTYNEGDGRAGIYIGGSNRGTIRLANCHVAEFPNNGVYASRTYGRVQVVGGTFENNDISQVRLGSEGSFLSNADVRVDVKAVSPPNRPADFLNPRGVRIESGDLDTAGVVVRDTDFTVTSSTRHPPGAIEIGRAGGRFHVRTGRIRPGAGAASIGKLPNGGNSNPPPPGPHGGTIENVDISGAATKGNAIHLVERPGTTITNTTIHQPTGNRDGIRLVRSPGCKIRGGSIVAGRYPVFVAVSSETDDADCLVTIDGVNHIESRGKEELSREQTALLGPMAPLLRGCVTPRMITDDRDSNLVVSITGRRFGRLYGVVHSS